MVPSGGVEDRGTVIFFAVGDVGGIVEGIGTLGVGMGGWVVAPFMLTVCCHHSNVFFLGGGTGTGDDRGIFPFVVGVVC